MRYIHWLLMVACLATASHLRAAEIVRQYPMGEGDTNPVKGEEADGTVDTLEFPDSDPANADAAGPFVDLIGFGTYVDGRSGPDSFALEFDGVDFLEGDSFDPRNFRNSFTALSQGWFKPDSESAGIRQHLWAVGPDNGGVAISEDGFYELVAGGSAGTLITDISADFDEWTHLAVLRGGNGTNLYLNGGLVARAEGFWNGPGTFYLGAGPEGVDPFDGAIDDFTISGFGDGSFVLSEDLTFFDSLVLSGVTGDVDQDGIVNESDYETWVRNAGFDNGLGAGDVTTLLNGDLDQNGRINFFDFQIIRAEAAANGVMLAAIPEPSSSVLCGLSVVGLLALRRTRSVR